MVTKTNKVVRTTEGVRDVLFDELDAYLSGKVLDEHANTVQKLTNAIMKTVAKDIEATKLLMFMNTGEDRPKSIADLNLNLILTGRGEEDETNKL